MRARSVPAGIAVLAAAVLTAAPADAATTYYMFGYAGGSEIRAVDNSITSQLSADSELLTSKVGMRTSNTLAGVKAQGVLSLGAVNTSVKTTAVSGGRQISARAASTNVNVLNGLIRATSISTSTTTKRVNGVNTSSTHSSFAGLHITGLTLPVDIPQNYSVKVGDIASVTINSALTTPDAVLGAGLRVVLLEAEGSAAAGTEIDVNPTFTTIARSVSPGTGHAIAGHAFATRITAGTTVRSAQTVPTDVSAFGTGGGTLSSTLASVNLAPVGTVGTVRTTGFGINTTTDASVTMTASAANINLFQGDITASAVQITAHADLTSVAGDMTLANLKVGSVTIPLNVGPNTVITTGIARVTVNQQIRLAHSVTIRALDIVLTKATDGLPMGAEIQVASATAAAA